VRFFRNFFGGQPRRNASRTAYRNTSAKYSADSAADVNFSPSNQFLHAPGSNTSAVQAAMNEAKRLGISSSARYVTRSRLRKALRNNHRAAFVLVASMCLPGIASQRWAVLIQLVVIGALIVHGLRVRSQLAALD
jgi:hypothetical protein